MNRLAGAFQWNWDLCSDPQLPQCPLGSGGFGSFGAAVPEPSTALLLMSGLALLAGRRPPPAATSSTQSKV